MTAKSGVSEEWTETNTGDVTAVSDLGDVAMTTGVGELGTGTSTGNVTVMSGVSEKRRNEKKRVGDVTAVSDLVTWQ